MLENNENNGMNENNAGNADNGETPEKTEGYRWREPAPEDASYHAGHDSQPEPVYEAPKADAGQNAADGEQQKRENENASAHVNENPDGGYHRFEDAKPVIENEKPKKTHFGAGKKAVAMMLVCSLIGGGVGAGAMYAATGARGGSTSVSVSNRTVGTVKQVSVDGQTEMTPSEVYAANVNAVVSINVSENSTNIFGQTVQNAASGSGFVITADGYIVTNYHVVSGATAITVTTYDGKSYTGTYVGGDEENDIAVVKIDATGLSTVVIGDSTKLNVGDQVNAIGNPLGELTFSLTTGVVSSCNRAIQIENQSFEMIQIDCAINPGNSGGPLLNSYGEVVGIVSAKYSSYSTTTVEGVGFAIPISTVWSMIEDIMQNGHVTNKPYIGITAQTVTSDMAKQYNLVQGVYVYSVEQGGAAEKSGLQAGDIITKIDDKTVSTMDDLSAAKKSYKAGDTCTLTVYRSGKSMTVELTFGEEPAATTTTSSSSGSDATSGATQNGGGSSGSIGGNGSSNGYSYYFNNGSDSGSSYNGSYSDGYGA
jgi:serine protease Do